MPFRAMAYVPRTTTRVAGDTPTLLLVTVTIDVVSVVRFSMPIAIPFGQLCSTAQTLDVVRMLLFGDVTLIIKLLLVLVNACLIVRGQVELRLN